MCKEMPVIPVNRVVDKRRIIGKNKGLRSRRRGTRARCTPNIYIGTYTYIYVLYTMNKNNNMR
jgi:hypothetical protein